MAEDEVLLLTAGPTTGDGLLELFRSSADQRCHWQWAASGTAVPLAA